MALLSTLLVCPPAAAVDHSLWTDLLRRYVDGEGRVAYRSLERNDLGTLDRYFEQLAAVDAETLPRPERLALWINAYNALIVRGVLDGRTAESFLGRRRLFRWYSRPIAGQDRTAHEIEHEILRPLGEPRIHFTIVCASSSCPTLRREAYAADRLDVQLDEQARRFIGDPTRNVIDVQRQTVRLSRVFEWFADDFEKAAGSVPAFVVRYVDPERARFLQAGDYEIAHMEYDWTLNAQPDERVGR